MKNELHSRLEVVEKRLDEHIHDGIQVWKGIEEVKTDLRWIKRAMYVLFTCWITLAGALLKLLLHTFI